MIDLTDSATKKAYCSKQVEAVPPLLEGSTTARKMTLADFLAYYLGVQHCPLGFFSDLGEEVMETKPQHGRLCSLEQLCFRSSGAVVRPNALSGRTSSSSATALLDGVSQG